MVDFRKLLSPEARQRLDWHEENKQAAALMTDQALLVDLIHAYHNMEIRGRFEKGRPCYDDTLVLVYLPELIRRQLDGKLPTKCPLCGRHIDW